MQSTSILSGLVLLTSLYFSFNYYQAATKTTSDRLESKHEVTDLSQFYGDYLDKEVVEVVGEIARVEWSLETEREYMLKREPVIFTNHPVNQQWSALQVILSLTSLFL